MWRWSGWHRSDTDVVSIEYGHVVEVGAGREHDDHPDDRRIMVRLLETDGIDGETVTMCTPDEADRLARLLTTAASHARFVDEIAASGSLRMA